MPKVYGIKKKTLKLILEAAKSTHPQEFMAILRAKKGVINEILMLPGTVFGNRHSIVQLHMLPIDFSVVGTVHSHPSPSGNASDSDLLTFSKFGCVHIIVYYPYCENCWQAYDHTGRKIDLEIVD
ncbi:MAG: hypothetical protein DRN20_01975 [Thermoplasmata archaeon]|nr:MAG: hypothetical protein DRN20_01975 [Thermoplasmata archaeon]